VKVARKLFATFAAGFEYYVALRPSATPSPLPKESHLRFGALDVVAFRNIEVNFGLGGGLTEKSAGLIGKVILGYTFGR